MASRVFDAQHRPALAGMTARAVCCIDASGVELLAANAQTRRAPASLAKLMTALLLVRSVDLDETIEIEPREASCRGSVMGLRAGDIVRYRDLLYGLLLPSGNDAAMAIARAVGAQDHAADPVESFVRTMNRHALTLGLTTTRFRNPSGLDAFGQYSCARDLALLTREAFRHPEIRVAMAKRTHGIQYQGRHRREQALVSTLEILGDRDVVGGKTGSTRRAGACLALLACIEGREVAAVTLGSAVRRDSSGRVIPGPDQRYADIRRLLTLLRDGGPLEGRRAGV